MYPEIRKEMKRQNIRLRDLAEYLGISTPALSMKLSGRSPIKLEECYKILQYLRIRPDLVFEYFPPRKELIA